MTRTALAAFGLLALAACSDQRLTPAPGQAPGWPTQDAPRPSYAPLPWTTNYAPTAPVQTMDPVPPGTNVPYAVPAGAAAPLPVTQAPNCHKVPTTTIDGKPASTVCQNADGSWTYLPD